MTYFRCVFQRVSISSSDKTFWILSLQKNPRPGNLPWKSLQLPVFLSIMCYNGDIMKLKENIMDFLDKEQVIVVIVCGILIIIGISI